MKPEKKSPKAEVVEALTRAHEALSGELSPLQWSVVGGLVFYALKQLDLVQELKRPRGQKRAT